ncbi:cobalamin B12-binding domain-containing protein [Nonomuraea aridisoli]|uniref:Cobalamin-binding protein n=1 Tax=Nonomuraea aridisoli TaxID=2070368 RepID=A0A2W2D2X9_9ACTN|nr:cobalamin-dependent protein [Nonomuraea aridisoli]PZG06422.1 cobalamin-binding protein [Nonomuraea aridisoli]
MRIDERAEALWAAAIAGDEDAAADVVLAALDAGVPMESVLLDVVAAVQARAGREWADNRITVAQEHTATAVNDRVLAVLAHHPSARDDRRDAPARGRVVVACVDGEWHAFPARLLAEVLRLRGWRVDYLGAQVPAPHLIGHLHRTNPDAVALSSSLAVRLPAAHAAITACQSTGVPVLAGGAAFGPDGRYARLLGADAWAPDACAAADLLASGPLPRRSGGEPPHLAGHEYDVLTEQAADLVRGVMGELGRRVPQMTGYTEEQLARTAEDIAYIVEFLRAALYVSDPELFTSFVAWMAGVLTSRGVPTRALSTGLRTLAARLTDLPGARDMLERAQATLRADAR